jgi:ferredoxin
MAAPVTSSVHDDPGWLGRRPTARGSAVVETEMDRNTQKRGLRIYVDPDRCIANAKCTAAAPGIFVLDDETGIAVIEHEEDATVEQLFAGARACPTQAIIIEQFGRRVYPRILTPMFGQKPADDGENGDDGANGR